MNPHLWRRLVLICTIGAAAGLIVIPLNPVSSTLPKLAFLACGVGLWLGVTALAWKRKSTRIVALTLPLLAAFPFLLPGREIDGDELRHDYVRRMSGFEGTKYHWGGESHRGIDCSGLPRRALRDALLADGVRNFNGRAFRQFFGQWWFDASAKALGEGYRDYTLPLGTSGTIQQMAYDDLIPGDLAITTNGIHIMAYAGEGRWIQADPGLGRVATLNGKTEENVWFHTPVTTHRWRILAGQTNTARTADGTTR